MYRICRERKGSTVLLLKSFSITFSVFVKDPLIIVPRCVREIKQSPTRTLITGRRTGLHLESSGFLSLFFSG